MALKDLLSEFQPTLRRTFSHQRIAHRIITTKSSPVLYDSRSKSTHRSQVFYSVDKTILVVANKPATPDDRGHHLTAVATQCIETSLDRYPVTTCRFRDALFSHPTQPIVRLNLL